MNEIYDEHIERAKVACSEFDNFMVCQNKIYNLLSSTLNKGLIEVKEIRTPEYKKKPLIAALEKRITRLNKVIKTL